ncbi:MAG: hypothetical protein FJ276_03505 [Planctomycetes bacterium]|nr:hypothetical protein [Planctomycetota bacterium]
MVLILAGCSDDGRLARVAQQASEQQARQNEEMARLTGEVVQASQELVAADAQARRENAAIQSRLTDQQREIGLQRDQLEQERRQIAVQRHRDPVLAAAITTVGWILAALLPLALAALVVWRLRDNGEDVETLNRVLLEELVAEQPRLLPPPSRERQLCLPSGNEPDNEPPF